MSVCGNMAEVVGIDCRVAPYDWAFPRDDAERIDRHWACLLVDKPGLYDGRVLLARDLRVERPLAAGAPPGEALARLQGTSFEVGYKSFLAWRDFGFPGPPVFNVFAMPALRAADGAFMLGRMSRGTANAGRLYFPAGTPEPLDVGLDGRIDFDSNMLRELEEETGLTASEVDLAPSWTIVFAGPLTACMKVARANLSASELQARVATFIASQAAPELDDLVAMRGPDDFEAAAMPAFMTLYLSAAFARSSV